MADVFGFRENMGAGPPDTALHKYRPAPGEVIVEVYNGEGRMIFMDSFQADVEAPRGSRCINADIFNKPYEGIPATYHSLRDAAERAFLYWKCPVDAELPFEVPDYILKPDAHELRLWWGSHKPRK